MASESARNKEMRGFMKRVLDHEELAYDYPSSRLILMFKNWSKMSKFVRSADDKDKCLLDGDNIITKDGMRLILSLLNGKDGSKAEKCGNEVAAPASAGSGEKSIKTSEESKECGGRGMRRQMIDNCPVLTFEENCDAGRGMRRQMRDNHPVLTFEESCVAELELAGSGGKSIQPSQELKKCGGKSGMSTLLFTSIYAGRGMRRQMRDNHPVLTSEESCVAELELADNQSCMLGCEMMMLWGGRCSVFGFEGRGVTGDGVLGHGMMTGVLGRGMMTQWEASVIRSLFRRRVMLQNLLATNLESRLWHNEASGLWDDEVAEVSCPVTTLAAQNRFLMSAPRLLEMFVRHL